MRSFIRSFWRPTWFVWSIRQTSLEIDVCRYYSLFTLGMLVMFECTVVGSRIRNVKELRSLQTPKQGIQVSAHHCVPI